MIMRQRKSNPLRAAAAVGIAAAALAAFSPSAAQAQVTAFAIGNGGTTLIRFDTSNPGAAVAVGNFSGAANFLDAIDFRPQTGQLYGYLDATDTLYLVDTNTGALTPVGTGTGAAATNTNLLGMDFNPTIDRVRIVTEAADNVVFDPNTGAATGNTPLFFAAGDPNENAPLGIRVIENAYNNNVAGLFGTTTQFGIDYGVDALVTIANNAGTVTTIGSLGININDSAPFVGFDIFTSIGGVNSAFAILDTTPGNAPGLYTINLATGAATSVGAVGQFTQVYSLALSPLSIAAPEPGTALLGLGAMLPLVGAVALRSRRRK